MDTNNSIIVDLLPSGNLNKISDEGLISDLSLPKTKRINKRIIIALSLSIFSIFLIGMIFLIYIFINSTSDISISATVSSTSQIETKGESLIINGVQSHLVSSLVIKNTKILHINPNYFPNLKELVYDDPYLSNLNIDQRLKIQSLVIRQSNLTTFSYNSTELRNLLFLENQKLSSFQYSNLTNLTNLTVVQTRFRSWRQNSFGNLSYVEFRDVLPTEYPKIQARKIDFLYFKNISFYEYLNLDDEMVRYFKFQNVRSLQMTLNSHSVNQIQLISCYEPVSIQCQDCLSLTKLSILNATSKFQLAAINCPILTDLVYDEKWIYTLELHTTNISEIKAWPATYEQLYVLIIINSPFIAFNDSTLPKPNYFKHITLDYSRVKYPSPFTINYSSIYTMTFMNYKSDEPLNLPWGIITLSLINCNLPTVNGMNNSNYLQAFEFINVVFTDPDFNIYNRVLKRIYFQNFNIKNFSSKNVSALGKIEFVNCQLLEFITDSYLYDSQFGLTLTIRNCSNLKTINKNYFNIVQLELIDVPQLVWEQNYESKTGTSVILGNFNQSQLNNVSSFFEKVIAISLNNNRNVTSFSKIDVSNNYPSIDKFEIVCEQKCKFFDNFLPNVHTLILEGFSNISNNYLRNLTKLVVYKNPELKMSTDLLPELQSWKYDGTNLEVIVVGKQVTDAEKTAIKGIYPNIQIVVDES